jgi:hypothetical protein
MAKRIEKLKQPFNVKSSKVACRSISPKPMGVGMATIYLLRGTQDVFKNHLILV